MDVNILAKSTTTTTVFLYSFTVVLVLVQPFVAVVCEQLVLSEGCVDKAVHKGGGQVHTSGVHLGATASKSCHIQHRGHANHQSINKNN